ncbi:MAG: flagellar hook-length control protein FliK [Candidatus Krumholzibacteriota bacterium]|nr:flagellar hook-length control protein FliK [Candidatus Krumholzibacteriota bacterium]
MNLLGSHMQKINRAVQPRGNLSNQHEWAVADGGIFSLGAGRDLFSPLLALSQKSAVASREKSPSIPEHITGIDAIGSPGSMKKSKALTPKPDSPAEFVTGSFSVQGKECHFSSPDEIKTEASPLPPEIRSLKNLMASPEKNEAGLPAAFLRSSRGSLKSTAEEGALSPSREGALSSGGEGTLSPLRGSALSRVREGNLSPVEERAISSLRPEGGEEESRRLKVSSFSPQPPGEAESDRVGWSHRLLRSWTGTEMEAPESGPGKGGTLSKQPPPPAANPERRRPSANLQLTRNTIRYQTPSGYSPALTGRYIPPPDKRRSGERRSIRADGARIKEMAPGEGKVSGRDGLIFSREPDPLSSRAGSDGGGVNSPSSGKKWERIVENVTAREEGFTGGAGVKAMAGKDFRGTAVRLKPVLAGEVSSAAERHLVEQIRIMSVSGRHSGEVNISLHPEELGEMRIKITLREKRVKASFVVESAAVRSIIAGGSERLAESIAQEGFILENVDVAVGDFGSRMPPEEWERETTAAEPAGVKSHGKIKTGSIRPLSKDGIDILA